MKTIIATLRYRIHRGLYHIALLAMRMGRALAEPEPIKQEPQVRWPGPLAIKKKRVVCISDGPPDGKRYPPLCICEEMDDSGEWREIDASRFVDGTILWGEEAKTWAPV